MNRDEKPSVALQHIEDHGIAASTRAVLRCSDGIGTGRAMRLLNAGEARRIAVSIEPDTDAIALVPGDVTGRANIGFDE